MEKHSKIKHKKNLIPEQNQRPRRTAWILYALFFILVLAFSATPREAGALKSFDDAAMKNVLQPWKGDLDNMIERRIIRVLVTYSKTNFFLNGAAKHGFVYEIFEQFNKFLNNKLKKKGVTKKHLGINIVYVPVARHQLLPYLERGLGDIAAANLTVTTQRLEEVDFTLPYYPKARELVVTNQNALPVNSVEDLSGKTVYVRRSSSYFESLTALNKNLTNKGKAPVKIKLANENLEAEDILEMVNANLVQITVADNYLATSGLGSSKTYECTRTWPSRVGAGSPGPSEKRAPN